MTVPVLAVIPARRKSVRCPDKVIKPIFSKPLVQYVWEAAKASKKIDRVIVAVDDEEVKKTVEGFGAEAWMTAESHPSGTDRIYEVASQLDFEYILNLQADEPLLKSEIIDAIIEPFASDKDSVEMTTLITQAEKHEINDRNVVKVVIDKNEDAMYFSRSLIPCNRDGNDVNNLHVFKHIGMYGYHLQTLKKLTVFTPSKLEKIEKLEQLRALENGIKIRTVFISDIKLIGVDTEKDFERVKNVFNNQI